MLTHDPHAAEKLILKLLPIPGASCEEEEVAAFVKEQLLQAGYAAKDFKHDTAHKRTLRKGACGNLILKLPGNIKGPRRMLVSHLDTVPICVGCKPVKKGDWVRSGNPVTGLGADNRAGVGVILTAALELKRQNLPHPPLTFLWTVQEEIGLHGARHLSKGLLGKPQLAFNWDGGAPNKLTIGATGGYRMTIKIQGKASHAGGAPEFGISAIGIAGLAIGDLQRNGWHGLIVKGNQKGTSNVGVISGGAATNVVTDEVIIRAEARSHSRRFRERIVREIEKAFMRAAYEVKNCLGETGSVKLERQLDYDSFKLSRKEPAVQSAAEVIEQLGLSVEYAIANGGLDANWLTEHGFPTASMGCGQTNQHMTSEALHLPDYQTACQIALQLAVGESQ